ISALADQQIAAGIMWVPGSITFVIVLFVYLHRWLAPAAETVAPSTTLPIDARPATRALASELVSNP
ncbi:MAG TPA: cytochrome c oxidase assembly protein, partial [Solirubrobacteraceae bacterium]